MKKWNEISEQIFDTIFDSLLLWILFSGSITNRATLLGFLFFYLNMVVFMKYQMKYLGKEKKKDSFVYFCSFMLFLLPIFYALIWGYFDINLMRFESL